MFWVAAVALASAPTPTAAAALVVALDLVISVCTAVIHLAGALGRPVWILTPSAPEWRYLGAGESLPWYPAARLFRQKEAFEWDDVVGRVADELAGLSITREQ